MTPQEFKKARHSLGFSCAALAREWGMGSNGDRTVRRWEAGDVPVNPIAAYCIDMMLAARLPEIERVIREELRRQSEAGVFPPYVSDKEGNVSVRIDGAIDVYNLAEAVVESLGVKASAGVVSRP